MVLYPPSLLEHHCLSRECIRYRITKEPQRPIKALRYQTVKLVGLRNHGYQYNIYGQTRTMSRNAVKIRVAHSLPFDSCRSLPGEASRFFFADDAAGSRAINLGAPRAGRPYVAGMQVGPSTCPRGRPR